MATNTITSNFYTNVQVTSGKILYRGVENGRRVKRRVDYHPTLYVPSKDKTDYTTVKGEYVAPIKPGTIRDCRDFVKRYEGVENFKVYGNQRYEYAFLSEQFRNEITWDRNLINVCNIDIEVASENGFPEPASASEEIVSITMKSAKGFVVFGCGDYVPQAANVRYYKCQDEIDLIKQFVSVWESWDIDIVTGWNIKFFDIPYLVNRITKVLGEAWAKRLSPWGILNERTVNIMGKEQVCYLPLGVALLDYIELYKKYDPKGQQQESYKLDNIAHVVLKKRKIAFSGTLHTLYKTDFKTFIDYNIRDVELVDELDEKLKLIDLALTLAYDSRTNYEDVFAQTRMWDQLISNELQKTNVVVPPSERRSKSNAFVGAYVKDPIIGRHRWIASFDLDSLYPHLIMQFNISPEALVEPEDYTPEMRKILASNPSIDALLTKQIDTSGLVNDAVTLTPNGQFFRIHKQSFLAKMMEEMYNDRKVYKKKSLDAKKLLETIPENETEKRYEVEKDIAKFHNLQLAKKVCLNSAYGALGNEFFRFFDVRQAAAITTSGQLAIRWIERKLNEYLNKVLKTQDKDYVIASDTDSIYLSLDELVRQTIGETSGDTKSTIDFLDRVCEAKIQPFINKSYTELAGYLNAFRQKMSMKRESLADTGIWTAKKRYILNVHNSEGVQYAKPEIKVMGLEMVKSSTPSACREKLKEVIEVIINQDERAVQDFVEKFREEFKTLPVEDIAFPRGMHSLNNYIGQTDRLPIHVRGAMIYNALVKQKGLEKDVPLITQGEKVKFIMLKEPNILQSNVIAFPQTLDERLGVHCLIDHNTQFEKSFLDPLRIILDCIDWKAEPVATLASFFT
jgi:DNA polymerase elongation subunit (family B)